MISKKLHEFQNRLFDIFIFVSYLTYGLLAVGITTTAPKYMSSLDSIVQIYISLFLVIRFNPFRKIIFTDLDRKICFSAGIFLFTTTTINRILSNYLDNIKSLFTNAVKS
jgi:hypothetical protein